MSADFSDDTTIGLVWASLFSSLLLFFFGDPLFGGLAVLLLVLGFASVVRSSGSALALAGLLLGGALLRIVLSDFSLFVGDASAYLWDAIHAIEVGGDAGFFPPLSAAVAAAAYQWFGIANTSALHAATSVFCGTLVYRIVCDRFSNQATALSATSIYLASALSIWFGKTTYSEPIWNVLLLGLIWVVSSVRSDRVISATVLIAAGVTLASFARGTAPLLFMPLLLSLLVNEQLPLRQRLTSAIAVGLVFLLSLIGMLLIREPYLIGWQYSRVVPDISALGVTLSVGAVTVVTIAGVPGFRRLFGPLAAWRACLVGFAAIKVGAAIVMAPLVGASIIDLLLANELSFVLANFGVGSMLVGAGLIIMVRKSWNGDMLAFIALGVYGFGTLAINLQAAAADRPHEMIMYWSRYYLADLFIVHIIGSAYAIHAVLRYVGRWRRQIATTAVAFALIVGSIPWGMTVYAASHSYMSGSGAVLDFIRSGLQGQRTVIVANPSLRYGPYLPSQLLRSVAYYAPDVVEIRDANELGKLNNVTRVICINVSDCDTRDDLFPQSSLSQFVSWDKQLDGYQDILTTHQAWNLRSFDHCELSGGTVEISLANASCLANVGVLREGWHSIESSFAWSSDHAKLAIPLPERCTESPCSVTLFIDAYGASKDREVIVTASGRSVSREAFTSGEATTVTVEVGAGRLAVVELAVQGAAKPAELKGGNDNRTLGVALRSYTVN